MEHSENIYMQVLLSVSSLHTSLKISSIGVSCPRSFKCLHKLLMNLHPNNGLRYDTKPKFERLYFTIKSEQMLFTFITAIQFQYLFHKWYCFNPILV